MKKLPLFLLILALLFTGCSTNALPAESTAEDAPLTFGNAVMTDTPILETALDTPNSAQSTPIAGYIWRLKEYSINYNSSLLRGLQADGSGGFWILSNNETADGLRFTALHCSETGDVLSETLIPFTGTSDNSGCELMGYGKTAIFYDYIHFLTRGGGDMPAKTERYIRGCDLEGNELFSVLLTDLTDEENPYISGIIAKDDYCLVSTEKRIFALDKTGALLWEIETDQTIDILLQNTDGSVYVQTAFDGSALYPLDTDTHTLGQAICSMDDMETPKPGILGYDLLLTNNSTNSPKVYGFHFDSGEKTPLWDCGAMGMLSADSIVETASGKLIVSYFSLMSGGCLGQLVQEPIYEGQEIATLTLGTVGSLSATADTAVAMFNSMYPEFYLQVATYPDAETMNLAILSGQGPDIICMDGLSEEDYARNGQLLNLYDYLDRGDLVPEYLREYETDGALYRLSPVFSYGYLRSARPLSSEADTFAEYLAMAKENADIPIWEMSAENIICVMMGYSMTYFVDFDSHTCDFESAEFIALLELANMGRTLTEDEYLDADWLLSPGNVGIWDEPVGEGGFPNSGVLVSQSTDTFAIYAGTAHPEAAWNFFSLLLSEDIQRSYAEMTGACPVLQSIYAQMVPSQIQNYISSADGHWVDTSPIYDIVKEEAASYFSGDVSAETAAAHIQSRTMIYLGENQ